MKTIHKFKISRKQVKKKVPDVFCSVDNAQILCHNPVTIF